MMDDQYKTRTQPSHWIISPDDLGEWIAEFGADNPAVEALVDLLEGADDDG